MYVVDASLENEMFQEKEELAHQGPEEIQQLARRIDRTASNLGRMSTKELEEVGGWMDEWMDGWPVNTLTHILATYTPFQPFNTHSLSTHNLSTHTQFCNSP